MQRIAESELIINQRGAVYHLNVLPEEVAPTIITVGDPSRVAEVSKYFDHIEYQIQNREFITHTGTIGNKRISCISTGIGTGNIDIVMNELDALFNIDLKNRTIHSELKILQIFRLGTSGSLQNDIPVDSYLVSTHGLGIDNLMQFYRHDNNEEERQLLQAFVTHTQLHQQSSYPYITSAGSSLLKHFARGYHQGISITAPGFYGPQGRVLRLGLTHPHLIDRLSSFQFGNYRITNLEMETAAIYGLGRILGHQCVSLNVIVAQRAQKKFSTDPGAAIEGLIRTSLEIIAEI
jgi:uridine phosphorylase